ncbi:MAG: hypothetical protein K9J81_11470 [Desulfohalobiaceae bacterium]|nr:hypothetical protein [Desulfohalobiaceae bacterium]
MGLDLSELDLPPVLHAWYRLGLTALLEAKPPETETGQARGTGTCADLPQPWRSIAQEHPAPCATLWTYWQLAGDLGSKASPERTLLFRNIRKALGWPQADIVFWPPAELRASGLHFRSEYFWQGLAVFEPRFVLIFGRPAFKRLFPRTGDRRYGEFIQDHISYIFLPGPEDMLPDQKEAKRVVWNTLKTIQLPSM